MAKTSHHHQTTPESPYTALGYPLGDLPLPGADVTAMDMFDMVLPLLEGSYATLVALNVAFTQNIVTTEEGCDALCLLEGHLKTALHILKRWQDTERRTYLAQHPSTAKE